MSSQANHFKLGLFVLLGLGLAFATLLVIGVGHSLRKPMLVETYLDQSVQGLEVGSKVKYRGVDFGVVHEISFSRDRYEVGKSSTDQKRYILIEVAVDDAAYHALSRDEFLLQLKTEIARGLRFRLNAQGVTGLSFLELDYVDLDRLTDLPVTWTPENPYIPSAPGTLTKLLTSVEQVFRKLEKVDLAEVLNKLNGLLGTTEAQIRGADLATISTHATGLLRELRESNRQLQGILQDPGLTSLPTNALAVVQELRTKLERLDLQRPLDRLDATLVTADRFLAGKESDLAATLANLRVLSENFRALSETLKAQPASLLFGAPPPAATAPAPARR